MLCRESPQVGGDGQVVLKSTPEPQVEWPLVAAVHLAGPLPLASAEAPVRLGELPIRATAGGEERWHHERPLVLSNPFEDGGRFDSHGGGAR